MREELSELDHLREVERLARSVVEVAGAEGWLSYAPEAADASSLQRSVNALARVLRHYHFAGDGCVEGDDRPLMRLYGAAVLRPGEILFGTDATYEQSCGRLGVEPRQEGWGVWISRGQNRMPATMVVTAVDTTEGLIANWSRGIEVYLVEPLPSQVAQVRQGWLEPVALSPLGVRATGPLGRDDS